VADFFWATLYVKLHVGHKQTIIPRHASLFCREFAMHAGFRWTVYCLCELAGLLPGYTGQCRGGFRFPLCVTSCCCCCWPSRSVLLFAQSRCDQRQSLYVRVYHRPINNLFIGLCRLSINQINRLVYLHTGWIEFKSKTNRKCKRFVSGLD